jgi:hypothetical protein
LKFNAGQIAVHVLIPSTLKRINAVPYKNPIEPELIQALNTIVEFIEKTTGKAATSAEIVDALKRYFVLNEIKEHIEMFREGTDS